MLITLAVILILFGIVGLSVFFDGGDSSDFFLATLMFIIPGAVCAFFSYKRMKQLKIYKKYSDYIRYPIKMEVTRKELKEGSKDEYIDKKEIETLNSMIPLWKKKKQDITQDDDAQ